MVGFRAHGGGEVVSCIIIIIIVERKNTLWIRVKSNSPSL